MFMFNKEDIKYFIQQSENKELIDKVNIKYCLINSNNNYIIYMDNGELMIESEINTALIHKTIEKCMAIIIEHIDKYKRAMNVKLDTYKDYRDLVNYSNYFNRKGV